MQVDARTRFHDLLKRVRFQDTVNSKDWKEASLAAFEATYQFETKRETVSN